MCSTLASGTTESARQINLVTQQQRSGTEQAGQSMRDVAAMIRLARATMANIRVNIAIALGLKAVFLATTIAGYTGLWVAILADTGATVLVTANALRLLAFRADAQR